MNVTIDDANGAIIYNPPDAWAHEESDATQDRYAQTTSYSHTANSTATFRFNGTGIWWVTYGLETNDSAIVSLDDVTHTVSLNTGTSRPQALLWGQNKLSSRREHTVVVNNAFGSQVHVDAFIVEQSEAPALNVASFIESPEVQTIVDTKGGDNSPGLIAGLTISAFVVGMLFAFLICYIRHSRRSMHGDSMDNKSRHSSTPILPLVAPARGNSNTSNLHNASSQAAVPWEIEHYTEGRDRVGDLGHTSGARSQWRQRFSRAVFPNSRSAASNRGSIGSATAMTESNASNSGPSSPVTALSPGGMTLSSYFYAPSTMPSVGLPHTRDRQSLLTN